MLILKKIKFNKLIFMYILRKYFRLLIMLVFKKI